MHEYDQFPDIGVRFYYDPEETRIRVDSIADISEGTLSSSVLALLLDWLPVQVLLKDKDGKYLYLNRVVKRYMSNSDEDPVGTYDIDASESPDQVNIWRREEEESMRSLTINEHPVLWTDMEGRVHHNEVMNVPVVDQNDNVLGVAVLAHDVTRRAVVKQSRHLLDLLRHDWVNSLLRRLISRFQEGKEHAGDPDALIPGLDYSLTELRMVFEFMESYLVSLPSLMNGYPSDPQNVRRTELVIDVLAYMNRLSPLIDLGVELSFDGTLRVPLFADENSLRVMCYEMMQNHNKYGAGPLLFVTIKPEGDRWIRLAFVSPGKEIRDANAYSLMGSEGKRFPESGEKDPKGSGSGLHFCRTLVLAHNRLRPEFPEEYRDKYYGSTYDQQRKANVFWYVLPRSAK